MNKKDIRKNVLVIRDAISEADKARYNARIREIVTGMEEYREAEAILAYVSYKSEVDTTALIQQAMTDGKYIFLPKVSGNEMEFWKISSLMDLQEGYRGIREPVQSISFLDWIREKGRIANADTIMDIMEGRAPEDCKVMALMPGVAFDKERHRIGYGGGFYDRYLNRLLQQSEQSASADQTRTHTGRFILITAALAYSCQVLDQIPHEEHDRKPDLLITEQGIVPMGYNVSF